MNSLSTDLILYLAQFLNGQELYHLKLVNKYFAKTIQIRGFVEDYNHEMYHTTLIYTQSWYYQRFMPNQKGQICRKCGIIFKSRNALFQHLFKYNHYYEQNIYEWDGLQFKIRSEMDLNCVFGECNCSSKRFKTIADLYELENAILYTNYGKITLYKIYYKSSINTMLSTGRRFYFPCIILNFLNIYYFNNHFWLSYYKSYDHKNNDSILLIPIREIVEKKFNRLF